jgi:hypothetical protein
MSIAQHGHQMPTDASLLRDRQVAPPLHQQWRQQTWLTTIRVLQLMPWLLAAVIFACIVVLCLFTQPLADSDETGLYNPIYEFVQTGRMTYPVYSFYDAMFVHPPVHYLEIGLLMKAGFSLAYAEAVAPILLSAIVLLVICLSTFTLPVKIGLLFGYFAGLTFYLPAGITDFSPTPTPFMSLHEIRPDVEVAMVWFAGLVALESGRVANWDVKRLALGSALLTYASGIHYFAAIAFSGALVYVAWSLLVLRRAAWPRIASIVAGGSLVGVPYIAFFVIPQWDGIRLMASSVQGTGTVADAITRHYAEYQAMRTILSEFGPALPLASALILPTLSVGVPLFCVSTLLLLLLPNTRGLALAALPLQLFVFAYSQGKSGGYYLPELIIYFAATSTALATLTLALLRKLPLPRVPELGAALLTTALAASTLLATPRLSPIDFSLLPLTHPMELARAAGRDMLGPDATVAGRIGLWYASGAQSWRELESDVLWQPVKNKDMTAYFSRFDAIADQYHMSNATSNDVNKSLSSWFVDGTLNIRAFYFAGRAYNTLSYVLFQPGPAAHVIGYASDNNQLYRFDEQSNGDTVFAAIVCPTGIDLTAITSSRSFENVLLLPGDNAPSDHQVITLLMPLQDYQSLYATRVGCVTRDELTGRLRTADRALLLERLFQDDRPIQFYPSVAAMETTSQVTFDPPSARPGDRVHIHIEFQDQRDSVKSVAMSANTDPHDELSGDWRYIGDFPAMGRQVVVDADWDTSGLEPGTHRMAINFELADGETIFYYDLAEQSYQLH